MGDESDRLRDQTSERHRDRLMFSKAGMCQLELTQARRTLDHGAATLETALRKATQRGLKRSLAAEFFGKNHPILDREAAAVGDVRGRGVRGVSDQNHVSSVPGR